MVLLYLAAATPAWASETRDLARYFPTFQDYKRVFPWGSQRMINNRPVGEPYHYQMRNQGPSGGFERGRAYLNFRGERYIDQIQISRQRTRISKNYVLADTVGGGIELIEYEDPSKNWAQRLTEEDFRKGNIYPHGNSKFFPVFVGDRSHLVVIYWQSPTNRHWSSTKFIRLRFAKGPFMVQLTLDGAAENKVDSQGQAKTYGSSRNTYTEKAVEPYPTSCSVVTIEQAVALGRIVAAKLPGGGDMALPCTVARGEDCSSFVAGRVSAASPVVFHIKGERFSATFQSSENIKHISGAGHVFQVKAQMEGTYRGGLLEGRYTEQYTLTNVGWSQVKQSRYAHILDGLQQKGLSTGILRGRLSGPGMLSVEVRLETYQHQERTHRRVSGAPSGFVWGPWEDQTGRMTDPTQAKRPVRRPCNMYLETAGAGSEAVQLEVKTRGVSPSGGQDGQGQVPPDLNSNTQEPSAAISQTQPAPGSQTQRGAGAQTPAQDSKEPARGEERGQDLSGQATGFSTQASAIAGLNVGKEQDAGAEGGPLPDWAPAVAGAAAGLTAGLGSLLMLGASGVSPREAWEAARDLLTQQPEAEAPPREEVTPEPAPEPKVAEPPPEDKSEGFWPEEHHRDGQSNEYGEVWSEMDGGWVSRKHYEYWRGEARAEVERAARANEELKYRQDAQVKEAYDKIWEEEQKLQELQQQHAKNAIARQRERVAEMEELSSKGYNDALVMEYFFNNVDKDLGELKQGVQETAEWTRETMISIYNDPKAALKSAADTVVGVAGAAKDMALDAGAKALEIGGDMARAGADTVKDLVTHPIDSATKVADFYYDTGTKTTQLAVNGVKAVYQDPWTAAKKTWEGTKKVGEVVLSPLTDIVDQDRTLGQRLRSVGWLMVDVATARGGSAARGGANLIIEGADAVGDLKRVALAGEKLGDAALDVKKMARADAGVLRARQTGEILEKKTSMIKELNTLAKSGVDDHTKQAMLARIKQQDSATFNLVRKELHPYTAGEVNRLTKNFNEDVLNKMSRQLKEDGLEVERVKIAGNTSGADCDTEWIKITKNGKTLSEAQAQQAVDAARDKVIQKHYGDWQVSAEDLSHKTMNNSPEKFAANPRDMGVPEVSIKSKPDGGLDFEHAVTKGKSAQPPHQMTRGKALSDDICHREFVDSVGTVLKTKTDDLAAKGAEATHYDYMNTAREIHKTHNRTVAPLAEKIGHNFSPEYKQLMQDLAAAEQGRKVTGLPSVERIEHVIDNEIRQMSTKVPTATELAKAGR